MASQLPSSGYTHRKLLTRNEIGDNLQCILSNRETEWDQSGYRVGPELPTLGPAVGPEQDPIIYTMGSWSRVSPECSRLAPEWVQSEFRVAPEWMQSGYRRGPDRV